MTIERHLFLKHLAIIDEAETDLKYYADREGS